MFIFLLVCIIKEWAYLKIDSESGWVTFWEVEKKKPNAYLRFDVVLHTNYNPLWYKMKDK